MIQIFSKYTASIGFLALLLVAATDQGFAKDIVDFNHPAFATVSNRAASIPVGHADFCKSNPSECHVNQVVVDTEKLTEAKWQELLNVNNSFNTAIVPVSDNDLYKVEEFWTYPAGYGDCEDFALAKRRQLIQEGWDASTLLMTVVRQPNGEGHAVLMVRTDRGDLVLDNLEGLIKLWNETPYRFIKRQSQTNSAMWVDILDDRTTIVASR